MSSPEAKTEDLHDLNVNISRNESFKTTVPPRVPTSHVSRKMINTKLKRQQASSFMENLNNTELCLGKTKEITLNIFFK